MKRNVRGKILSKPRGSYLERNAILSSKVITLTYLKKRIRISSVNVICLIRITESSPFKDLIESFDFLPFLLDRMIHKK